MAQKIEAILNKVTAEDIEFGDGQVTQTRKGVPTVLTKVNATHIPLKTATSSGKVNIEDGLLDVDSRVKDIDDKLLRLSKFNSLSDALTSIGTAEKTLIIDRIEKLTADVTVPENVTLMFLKGAYIDSDTTVGTFTLTINGGIDAGLYRIFGDNVTVTGNPKVEAAYPEWFGTKGDGVSNDTQAIQKAIDFIARGVVIFSKDYKIASINGKSSVSLLGRGGKIITSTRADVVVYDTCQDFFIKGLKIDCSATSISSAILVINSSNFLITENEIYNYTEDASSLDTDAGIKVSNVENGIIESNYIHDFGNTAVVLVRAISLDAISNTGQIGIRVRNNRLKNVRMAIMHAGGYDNIIEGNICENASDNGVYVLDATREVIIQNNKILGTDEGIVCSGERIIIADNIIDVPSYAINLKEKVNMLIVSNNIIKCGVFFSVRSGVVNTSNIVKLSNNIVQCEISYAMIYPKLISLLHIENNQFLVSLSATATDSFVYSDYDVVDMVVFSGNTIKLLTSGDTTQYKINHANTTDFILGDNETDADLRVKSSDNVRTNGLRWYRYDLDDIYIKSSYKRRIFFGSVNPPTIGVWNQGDIIIRTDPTKDVNNMVAFGWICTQSGDFSVTGGEPVFEPLYISAVSPAV